MIELNFFLILFINLFDLF